MRGRLAVRKSEIDRLRDALAQAEQDVARLRKESKALDAAQADLDQATVDEFLGDLEPAAYERQRADLEARRRDVAERLSRTEVIVATLSRRCAEQVEEAGRQREAEIRGEIDQHVSRAEEHRAKAASEDRLAEEATERLASAEAETVSAVAAFLPSFDPAGARRAGDLERQRIETARWWARAKPHKPEQWPAELRSLIRAEIDVLKAKAEAENAQLREASEASLAAFGMSEQSREWIRQGRPVNG
jgi:hypothetical protein